MSQDGRSAPVRPHTPLLPQLDAKTLDEIRRHARPRRYAAGDVICREVARTDSVLILQRGSADVYVTSSVEMRTATVGHLRAGDIVGEVGALTGLPRSATVVASSRACALEIKWRDFDRLLEGHPRLQTNLTRILGARLASSKAALRRTSHDVVVLVVGTEQPYLTDRVLEAAHRPTSRPAAIIDLCGARDAIPRTARAGRRQRASGGAGRRDPHAAVRPGNVARHAPRAAVLRGRSRSCGGATLPLALARPAVSGINGGTSTRRLMPQAAQPWRRPMSQLKVAYARDTMDDVAGEENHRSDAKLVSLKQALAAIRPGSRIYLGTGCAAPRNLLAGLEAMQPGPPDLEFVSFVTTSALPVATGACQTRYRHRTFFVGSDVRSLVATGEIDYVPIALEEVPRLLASGRLPIDVALLQVSPPDARGYVSLGVSIDLAPAVLNVARRVIAEVNPAMPRTQGESFVHLDRFDALVQVDTPVAEYRHPETGEVAERVARYIAAIIDDGSTLQIGLGRVPNEALRHLKDRRDIGIHTDVITDGIMDLVEAGVVTGRRKARHHGRIVASYCLGTRRLYDFIDDNPRFLFLPIDQVCDPAEIAATPRLVSITQAFAIDLTGQVCVDQFEGQFYGGLSTQAAFIRGAARSPGGKPIICLASTTDDGASRIKPQLEPGDGVGIARSDVHYVITEYGIAFLFGKSIRERAIALIEVAHPRWRDDLLKAAKQLRYVPSGQYVASQAPYLVHEERTVELKNGAKVLIRPARAADAGALQALFHRLSPDDVYTRFFRRVRSLSFAELQNLCNVNHETAVAFLGVTGPRENEEVVGSACYFLSPTTNLAETAFMVAPEWQGLGVGTALQARLQEYAVSQGVRGFVAEILPQNQRMQRLASGAPGTVTTVRDQDAVHFTILFADQAPDEVAAGREPPPSMAFPFSGPTATSLNEAPQ